MRYISTRDTASAVSGAQAIVSGISPEGGLFVPAQCPVFSAAEIESLRAMSYVRRAAFVLAPWLPEFSGDELSAMCASAYARFDEPAVTPVVDLPGDVHVLELWHGPTLAFKDVALQLLPRLMTASAKKIGEKREILILVATSGDTGKAALEGFRDVPGVRICVFYPKDGVSEAQRLQMVTQEGQNTRVVAVRGNFDDAQTGVKRIFTSKDCQAALGAQGTMLSSANSINLGRLIPQIVYYFSAYADLRSRGVLAQGAPMNVCVPTGNFGNILAAYYARAMGLPIRRLICASNENNVLTDFIRTGVYDRRRPFRLTSSPSMDILISSNLERLLFELSGQSDAQVRAWMRDLSETGAYRLHGQALEALDDLFYGGFATEDEVKAEIGRCFEKDRYLIDPHTAVGMCVLRAYRKETGDQTPILVDSTASPYKFGRSVLSALTGETPEADDFVCCARLAERAKQCVPAAIADLPNKTVLHRDVCAIGDMWDAVRDWRR